MSKACATAVACNARLLLVEPDHQARAWLLEILTKVGCELWVANSCTEARTFFQRTPGPDVAIVALEQPDGCGLALIAEILNLATSSECVAASFRPTVQSVTRAMRLGATNYLAKPYTDACLVTNAVECALDRAAQHRVQELEEQELVAREERYALALAASNDGVWDWDLDTNCLYLSRRWKEMLGFEDSELGTSPDEWFSRIHPEDLDAVRARVIDRLGERSGHFEIDYRLQTKCGSYVWVRTRGLAVQDAAGRTTRVAGILGDISSAKRMEGRLVYEALHDGLTRLANRGAFHAKLLEAFERRHQEPEQSSFAVLFVDLDRFKDVNDSLGHQAGDQLLLEVSRRLQASLRGSDHLARLGGDEFAILISGVKDMQDVAPILRRIEGSLRTPCTIEGHRVVPSASIGVAFGSGSSRSPEEIVRNADIAMYKAKGAGRGRSELFEEGMHLRAHSFRPGIGVG